MREGLLASELLPQPFVGLEVEHLVEVLPGELRLRVERHEALLVEDEALELLLGGLRVEVGLAGKSETIIKIGSAYFRIIYGSGWDNDMLCYGLMLSAHP